MTEISENLASYGFHVSAREERFEDEEEGTVLTDSWVVGEPYDPMSNDFSSNSCIGVTDRLKDSDRYLRELSFGNFNYAINYDAEYDSRYVINEELHDLYIPLPFDIKLGDTFETVILKMGFRMEDIEDNSDNFWLDRPDFSAGINYTSGVEYLSSIWIKIKDTDNHFLYSFTNKNILEHYSVRIHP